jgi:hypothetical protein
MQLLEKLKYNSFLNLSNPQNFPINLSLLSTAVTNSTLIFSFFLQKSLHEIA